MATATLTIPRSRTHGPRHDSELLQEGAPVSTVFRGQDWDIFHSRCRQKIQFQGTRGGRLEADFYCLTCQEHVTLPAYMLDRIPYVAEQ